MKSIWTLIVDDIFDVNKGLLYTVKQLWFNPGKTSLDFIHGRTRNYYSPVKYLIFWTAIYFILSSLAGLSLHPKSISDILFSSTESYSAKSMDDFMRIYSEMIFYHADVFYLGLTPFLTIVSYFVYRKKGFNFTELLILYLYILGQIVFVIAFILPALSLLGDNDVLFFFMFPLVLVIVYLVIKSHKQFFGETWIKSALKGLFILYAGQIIYLTAAFIALNLIEAAY